MVTLTAIFLLHSLPAAAQLPAPVLTIDEDCAAFAFAPDGRIAYAVRRVIRVRRIDMQRDDIWVTALDGKKKRIVNGEKLVEGGAPFSYSIQSMRWAPDGRALTVEMLTSAIIDERGNTREGMLTLLIDENGKEIKISGGDSVIPEGSDASWLADGATVAYFAESVQPRLLFNVVSIRPVAGRGTRLFENHHFAAIAWNAKNSTAVAIERDLKLQLPPDLVLLDIPKQTRTRIVEVSGFLGNLALSPSGKKVAYYADHETIEVRELDNPAAVVRVKTVYGTFIWGPGENRLLLKRGTAKRSADFSWISLPDGQVQPVLSGLSFRDFEISPDGKYLGVTSPGKRILQIFPLPE